jgi:regulator of protease activity HflC (stomatin/prohibitin superfamily)
MPGTIIILVVLAVLVIVFVYKGFCIVPQQTVIIIERLGKFQSQLNSGLNWIIPFVDRPREIAWRGAYRDRKGRLTSSDFMEKQIDLREIPYDIPPQNVITKDNVSVRMDGLVYFQITNPKHSLYEVTNVFQAIEKLAQTTLRSLVGDMALDETLSGRDAINTSLTRILDEATDKWGVKIHRVEIQDIEPPPDVKAAMEKQMKAERERRAVVTSAEGHKTADILTSEGEMQKLINLAEGEKQATIRRAEAEKRFLELRGEGEKTFIDMVKEGVGEESLVQYLMGIKYIEKIPEMFGGNNKIVVPYEAIGLMGALKSIEELLGKKSGQQGE